jgi:hypothetical protein
MRLLLSFRSAPASHSLASEKFEIPVKGIYFIRVTGPDGNYGARKVIID